MSSWHWVVGLPNRGWKLKASVQVMLYGQEYHGYEFLFASSYFAQEFKNISVGVFDEHKSYHVFPILID